MDISADAEGMGFERYWGLCSRQVRPASGSVICGQPKCRRSGRLLSGNTHRDQPMTSLVTTEEERMASAAVRGEYVLAR